MDKAGKFVVFLFVLILLLSVLNIIFDKGERISNIKDNAALSPEGIEAERIPVSTNNPDLGITISPGISLYKSPVIFEGYEYCSLVFDETEKNYVKDNENVYKKFCNLTNYPLIGEFLYPHYKVELIDQEDWQIAAQYIGYGEIKINKKYKAANNLDIYVAHEIAHSSTETLYLPPWLSEGIAVYSSYRYFDTTSKLTPYYFDGFLTWDPATASYSDNIKGYSHCGYVVKKFIENYGDQAFIDLLFELDGKISYDDDITTKNQKILTAMKLVTKDDNLTLEELISVE